MLTIRREQMTTLEFAMFERWLEVHMREHFPKQCANLSDAELLRVMRAGIAKGRRYGFLKPPDLCRFADIALVMGADFDTDASMPWASAVLNTVAISSDVRIELLETAATDHLRTVKEAPTEIDPPEEVDRDDEDEVWAAAPRDEFEDDADDDDDDEDEDEDEDAELDEDVEGAEEDVTAEASPSV